MFLLGCQNGCIEIGLVTQFLNDLEHLLPAFRRHLSPVVQDTVHRAFRHACHLCHIVYRDSVVFAYHKRFI